LLDEPTSHLDLRHQSGFLSLIVDLVKDRKLGVMIAFHDLNLISAYTQKIALMAKGRIMALGTPEAVLTVQNIQEAYNTSVRIVNHPDLDTPMIIPDRR
jgi:ABC-type hemin transport system ATPase subunit